MSKFNFTINCAKFAREKPQTTPTELATIKHAKSYLNHCILKELKTGDREMKYPAIYKSVEGSEYLYQNKDSYYCYERQLWDSSEPHHDCHHSDTNITTEYLANTYGEVKSKEHAHFIVELGEGAGYELVGSVSPNRAGVFVFDGENKTLFFMLGGGSLRGGSVLKQITIPLPPERESVDEWPKVGDNAILTNENDYGVTHGVEAIGKKVKVMSLFKDGDLDMAVIKHDITNYCFRVDMLQKPKTPEQELRDELMEGFCTSGYDTEKYIDILMSKYNITKKPQ